MFKLGVEVVIYEYQNKNLSRNCYSKEYRSPYTTIKKYSELGLKTTPKDLFDLVKKLERKYWIEGFDTTSIRKEGKIYISIKKKNKTDREGRLTSEI